ncbi:MutT/NUDIX family phosphohydrolase [Niallia circulans]|uniref:RNA deprotection pyrophosphohydrolase n=1 Tax=Shouchella clausii TaxID=79880 RepID=UPI000BA6A48F|nr:nucleoside triphosphatase YtkD [Shouchella clausii]MCM3547592.1 nucleoside triphosphatase YtkD [Shouchella clausii]PAF16395.1 nucleoside triphosphatase YtkD [Shouchella clausii]SPT80640.1 MutT/NUDIX family phosphohydrolase [Niallia circulans]
MEQFIDPQGQKVKLVLGKEERFTEAAGHVLVLPRFHQQWVLTEHRERGYEFPGGKVENGETTKDAAVREVWEETGAHIGTIVYIGQYQVEGRSGTSFCKDIFAGIVTDMEEKDCYMETKGPLLLKELPAALKEDPRFSFIMKDEVVPKATAYAIAQGILS